MTKTLTLVHQLGRWDNGDNPGAADLNFNWDTIDANLVKASGAFPSTFPLAKLLLRTDLGRIFLNVGTAPAPIWFEAGGLVRGTVFPASFATDGLFFRTDLGLLYQNTGTVNVPVWTQVPPPVVGLSEQDKIDMAWGKKFWLDNALLPANKIKEFYSGVADAPDFTNGGASWVPKIGQLTATAGASHFTYDLGAAKNNVLILVCGMGQAVAALEINESVPTGGAPDGYSLFRDGPGERIYKTHSGGFTDLADRNFEGNLASPSDATGYAFLWNKTAGHLRGFMREGFQSWYLTHDVNDVTYPNIRYTSFWSYGGAQRFVHPIVIYAD